MPMLLAMNIMMMVSRRLMLSGVEPSPSPAADAPAAVNPAASAT